MTIKHFHSPEKIILRTCCAGLLAISQSSCNIGENNSSIKSPRYAFSQETSPLSSTGEKNQKSIIKLNEPQGIVNGHEKNLKTPKVLTFNKQYNICSNNEYALDLNAKIESDNIYLSATCTNYQHTLSYIKNFILDGREVRLKMQGVRNLVNLFYPEMASRQSVYASMRGNWFYFSLKSVEQCQLLRASPAKYRPIPAYAVDRNGQWQMAFNFIADDDCSIIIIHVANKFIIIDSHKDNINARIYDVIFTNSDER